MNRSVSHFTLFECLHDDYTAIYQAENNLTNQKVLLKVLNPDLIESAEIKNAFVEQGNKLISLAHKNIIQVFQLVGRECRCPRCSRKTYGIGVEIHHIPSAKNPHIAPVLSQDKAAQKDQA